MYVKCGQIRNAQNLFDRMSIRDLVVSSALVSGYAKEGCVGEVMGLVSEMERLGVEMKLVSWNKLSTGFSHSGRFSEAVGVFFRMHFKGVRFDGTSPGVLPVVGSSERLSTGVQSRRKVREPKEEISLGPTVREGENIFGVAHIFASFNDTFIVSFGFLLKKSAKHDGWSKRRFVLNEKTGKDCKIEEISEDEQNSSKSLKDKKANGCLKDKKANGPDKTSSLPFKITSKVPYKTVLKAHNAVLLKAESAADRVEWIKKINNVIQPSKGQTRVGAGEGTSPMRHSMSDGSLDTLSRRPADPEKELRWMAQEVRGYVEIVLNTLAAKVPKAVVLPS